MPSLHESSLLLHFSQPRRAEQASILEDRMKLLSEAAESGLRATVWLAQHPDQTCKVKEIAEAIHAAPGYLVKVLQHMTRANIVAARRGIQGGITLVRPADELTALDVINAIDPIERITTCPLQLSTHRHALCPLHHRIDRGLEMIEETFRSVTIAQLMETAETDRSACHLLCGSGNENHGS